MFYFKFCQDNAFVVIVLSTFQIYIDIPRVNKQETHKQTNKQTVTKWLNTFTIGKCRKWIFLFTINFQQKNFKIRGTKNSRAGKFYGNWPFYIMLRALYFELYNNSRDHETKLAYALSLEHQKNCLSSDNPTYNYIHLTCNSTN